MRELVGLVAVLGLPAGMVAVGAPAEIAFPNPGTDRSRGKAFCSTRMKCPTCTVLEDLTPQNPADCRFVCRRTAVAKGSRSGWTPKDLVVRPRTTHGSRMPVTLDGTRITENLDFVTARGEERGGHSP